MYDALFMEFVQNFIYVANKFKIPIHMHFLGNTRYPNVVMSIPLVNHSIYTKILDNLFENLEDKGFVVVPLTENIFAIFHDVSAILLEIQIDGGIAFLAEHVPYDFSDEGIAG